MGKKKVLFRSGITIKSSSLLPYLVMSSEDVLLIPKTSVQG